MKIKDRDCYERGLVKGVKGFGRNKGFRVDSAADK